jgi:plasmid maintenance system antidote protein VapI
MTDTLTKGLRPTHPGEILREDVLPALAITKTRFAALLHVSRQTLYDLRLGRLLGNGPDVWLRLQGAYDLAMQAEAMAGELAQIETLEAA